MNNKITLQQIEELFDMLRGHSLPEGMEMEHQPALSPQEAFSVIWFLQEQMGLLPDHVELCDWCNNLFDDQSSGTYIGPDDWQEQGRFYDAGTHLCSMECESSFWRSQ